MLSPEIAKDLGVRAAMAAAIGAVGIAALVRPRAFAGLAGCFVSASRVPLSERDRFDRVIEARERMEGISAASGRYLGVACLVLAALEFVRPIPVVVPYVLYSLALAVLALSAYIQFHRSIERRVAPLARRSPLTALPPLVIAAMACSLLLTTLVAVAPGHRFDGLLVALSTLVLAVIAWRLASAPALLAGTDPQLEYAVDERVRICRARNVAMVACGPAILYVAIGGAGLPPAYHHLADAALLLAVAAFLTAAAAMIVPLRSTIRPG